MDLKIPALQHSSSQEIFKIEIVKKEQTKQYFFSV